MPTPHAPGQSPPANLEPKPAGSLPLGGGKPACCGGHAHKHAAAPTASPAHGSSGGTTNPRESSPPRAAAASSIPHRNTTPAAHPAPPTPHRRPSFLREFLANPIATAAIAPSSRHLAAAMLRGLDMAGLRTIAEFGPGTGVFTRATLESLRAAGNTQARFIALELNPRMAANLQAEFALWGEPSAATDGSNSSASPASAPTPTAHPRITILNDNALNIDRALADAGATHADLIISGLGWPSIPAAIRDAILEKTAASLAPGQEFRTFGYHIGLTLPGAWGFRKTVRRLFKSVTISPVIWRNLPPAFVYRCVK